MIKGAENYQSYQEGAGSDTRGLRNLLSLDNQCVLCIIETNDSHIPACMQVLNYGKDTNTLCMG